MICQKVWSMPAPAGETFRIPAVSSFLDRWLMGRIVIVDPFARNSNRATITNDLNPETTAQYHMDSVDFLARLEKDGVHPDAVIFDPPYSPRQIKELYDSIGIKTVLQTAHRTASWKAERDIIARILAHDGVVLSFGWNSLGMGKVRGFVQEEVLLICHGAAHNDTICVADVRESWKDR